MSLPRIDLLYSFATSKYPLRLFELHSVEAALTVLQQSSADGQAQIHACAGHIFAFFVQLLPASAHVETLAWTGVLQSAPELPVMEVQAKLSLTEPSLQSSWPVSHFVSADQIREDICGICITIWQP